MSEEPEIQKCRRSSDSIITELLQLVHDMDNKFEKTKVEMSDLLAKLNEIECKVDRVGQQLIEHTKPWYVKLFGG